MDYILEEDNDLYDKPLDNDWISEFEKIDNDYQYFYNENLTFLKIHCIYVNTKNEIEKIKEEKLNMNNKNNILSRDTLLGLLKNNAFICDKRYSVLSILKYNIDIHNSDIKDYVKSNESYSFLSVIKNIDDIVFNETINMFQDLNDLIIVFYEKTLEEQKNQGLIQRTKPSNSSLTKKIYIRSNCGAKKTRYKYKK
jgi:hypothetical protein